MKKMALLPILIFLLISCSGFKPRFGPPTKNLNKYLHETPDGPPDFQQGWRDGCQTGISSGANQFYKMFYKNNVQDGYKIVNNPTYEKGYSFSFWLCYRVANGMNATGPLGISKRNN